MVETPSGEDLEKTMVETPNDQVADVAVMNKQSTRENKDDLLNCSLPADKNIIHFPMRSWTKGADTIKSIEDTVEMVKRKTDGVFNFLEGQLNRLLRDDNSERTTDEDTLFDDSQNSYLDQIAYSQFKLAQLIQENPDALIFYEFSTHIQDQADLNDLADKSNKLNDTDIIAIDRLSDIYTNKMEHLLALVHDQFSNGVPKKYTDMSKEQKHILAVAGAVYTLWFLGELPVIFPSISQLDYENVLKGFPTGVCDGVLNILNVCSASKDNYFLQVFRAEKLSDIVSTFTDLVPQDRKIILAYDGSHDLKPYFVHQDFYRLPEKCATLVTESESSSVLEVTEVEDAVVSP